MSANVSERWILFLNGDFGETFARYDIASNVKLEMPKGVEAPDAELIERIEKFHPYHLYKARKLARYAAKIGASEQYAVDFNLSELGK